MSLAVLLVAGCATGEMSRAPVAASWVFGQDRCVLASGAGQADHSSITSPPTPSAPASTRPAPSAGDTDAAEVATTQPAGSTTRPASAATRPAGPLGYTPPSSPIQQITLLGGAAALGFLPRNTSGVGKEAAEAGVSAAGGGLLSSRPGLGATQPRTLSGVGSRPGLQRGFAAALGFAGPHTILTPQRSGVANACQALVRGGFFANQAACEQCFRR